MLHRSAVISPCGKFRYLLLRVWDDKLPAITFCMLNPSRADGEVDDPTLLTCVAFAKALGYGRLRIVNMYAYRATDPKDLKAAGWQVGPENDAHLVDAFASGDPVICAWGVNARGQLRQAQVLDMVRMWTTPLALAVSKDGVPLHPLYLNRDLVPFDLDAAVPSVEVETEGW